MFPVHNEGRKHKARVARVAKTHKSILLNCNVCNMTADSEIQLNIHLNGRKHLNKLLKNLKDLQLLDGTTKVTTPSEEVDKILEKFYCRVCNFQLTSLNRFSEHYKGKKHKTRAARAARKTISLTCDVCHITTNTEIQLDNHLNSRQHLKKLFKKVKAVQHKALTCDLCNITSNSEIQLNAHLNSRKHLKKLSRM